MNGSSANVLFLQDNGINESLALTELSAVLRQEGHETHLLLHAEEGKNWWRRIEEVSPDLVILPCNVFGHRFVLSQVQELVRRFPRVPVILGGTHPTFAPSILEQPGVSRILVGEADVAIPQFVSRLVNGESLLDIPGIWTQTEDGIVRTGPGTRLASLDELPVPHRELYFDYPFMAQFPWKKFTTGRGCHNRCAFCYNSFVQDLYCDSGFVRRKAPARVVAEVQAVASQARLDWVHFADDLFVTDLDWLAEFRSQWRHHESLPFSCNSSADRMNPDVARTLAEAGCRSVAIGVETANEETRMKMLAKPTSNEVIKHAAASIKGAGMKLVTFNMVGLPGESMEDAMETLRFSRRLGADATRVTMALPLPGTRMATDAARDGHLDGSLANSFTPDIDIRENPHGPYFSTGDDEAIEHILNIAPLLGRFGTADKSLALLRRLPPAATLPLRLWMSLQEKHLFRFSLWDGFRFYLHTGDPHARTTNYVALM